MRFKLLVLSSIGLCAALVAACHDHDNAPPSPPKTVTMQSLDTAQVLALAQQTSETSAPFDVNGGAVTLSDTSDTSVPIAVAAM
jgi:hypothetical protein